MTGLVVFTVIDVLLLIAGLAFYLFWVGSLLTRIAGNLEECADTVRTIAGPATTAILPFAACARRNSPASSRMMADFGSSASMIVLMN